MLLALFYSIIFKTTYGAMEFRYKGYVQDPCTYNHLFATPGALANSAISIPTP